MKLKITTLDGLTRVLDFLQLEKRGLISIRWMIGVVQEQRIGIAVPVRRQSGRSRPHNEADMLLKLTDTQQCSVRIEAKSKRGNITSVENVTWDTSDPSILLIEPDPGDPMAATIKAAGPTGTAQLNVTADARIGEGESQITGTLDVEIVAGEAATFQINAGEATEQEEGEIV